MRRREEAKDVIAQLVCAGFVRPNKPRMREGSIIEWWHLQTSDGMIAVRLEHPALEDQPTS